MDLWSVIQMLFALAFIIVLANVILKKLSGMQQAQSKAIKILERVPVSKSSALCIVEIANNYYLMSVSDKGTEMIRELSEEERIEIDQRLTQKKEAIKQSLDISQYSNWAKKKYTKAKEKYHQTFGSD